MRNPLFPLLLAILVLCAARSSPRAQLPYSQVFYQSGALRIEAYLYKPEGNGPFPAIVYNHGSRDGQDRSEQPMLFIGRLLTAGGYAVLVPERRGYGRSDGPVLRDEIGFDLDRKLLNRLREESGDVLAAVEYLKTDPSIDSSRLGMMGWSFGGIASVFAAASRQTFFAVVDQAGGALTWERSQPLQTALREAAGRIQAPTLCMDADNDATTDAVKQVCERVRAHGVAADVKIYPKFSPAQNPQRVAPGHLIFTAQGSSIWGQDVLAFFDAHRPR